MPAPGPLIRGVAGVNGAEPVEAARGKAAEAGTATFSVDGANDVRAEVCRALVEAGHDVIALARADRQLERLFVGLVGGEDD